MSALLFPRTSSNFFSMPNNRIKVSFGGRRNVSTDLQIGDILKCHIVKEMSDMLCNYK